MTWNGSDAELLRLRMDAHLAGWRQMRAVGLAEAVVTGDRAISNALVETVDNLMSTLAERGFTPDQAREMVTYLFGAEAADSTRVAT